MSYVQNNMCTQHDEVIPQADEVINIFVKCKLSHLKNKKKKHTNFIITWYIYSMAGIIERTHHVSAQYSWKYVTALGKTQPIEEQKCFPISAFSIY